VTASGNHLLVQVKDNQPRLRRRLELGTAGRKPIGADTSKVAGRNRWESREKGLLRSDGVRRDGGDGLSR
jgi:hypothetical protein